MVISVTRKIVGVRRAALRTPNACQEDNHLYCLHRAVLYKKEENQCKKNSHYIFIFKYYFQSILGSPLTPCLPSYFCTIRIFDLEDMARSKKKNDLEVFQDPQRKMQL